MKRIGKDFCIFLILMLFSGWLSVFYGLERMYDTRNYHIYNPWAFLTGRIGFDIMPAGVQSYFNPLLDIPYYWAIQYFNDFPTLITFLCGGSYALFLFMIYKISAFIFKDYHPISLSVICVIVASGISHVLRVLGWQSHDIFLGDLMLISLYLIFKSFNDKNCFKILSLAGFLSGMMLGLKYTTIIFAIPLGIVLVIFYKQLKNPCKSIFFFGICAFIGFIIIDGWWLYKLYTIFDNPLFPYANGLFNSKIIENRGFLDIDSGYRPLSELNKILFYPFKKDEMRLKLLWWIFVINLIVYPFIDKEKFKNKFQVDSKYADFILLYSFLSYLIWIKIFSPTRYWFPILGLVGISAILVSLKLLYLFEKILQLTGCKMYTPKRNKTIQNIFCILVSELLIFMCFPNFMSVTHEKKLIRFPINEKILFVENLNLPDNSIVFLGGGTGIILPFQNPKVQYIRLNPWEFSRKGLNLLASPKIKEIIQITQEHSDKLFLISSTNIGEIPLTVSEIRKKLDNYLQLITEREQIQKQIQVRYQWKERNKKDNIDILPKKTKSTVISINESVILELDRLSIDTTNANCHEIETNMQHSKTRRRHKYYLCPLKIKQVK